MNYVALFMTVFSVIGAADLILGNRFGLGKEFEKGFMLFGNLALSMIGIIVLAPFIGRIMQPFSSWIYSTLHIDSSILPSMIFANDMGGVPLAKSMANNEALGLFNGLIVASMMGCTVSFTIPTSLSVVNSKFHKFMLTGFLCGIITIPIGCFVSGIIMGIDTTVILIDLLPLILFSVIIYLALTYVPDFCVKAFAVLGMILKIIIVVGLILAIVRFLIGIEFIKGLDTLENGGIICLNACAVMSGAFPLLAIISKLIYKPMDWLAKKLEINKVSALGFISTLATSVTTFKAMEDMDEKGIVLNSAFAISAAFVFSDHLAYTLAINSDYILSVIVGKLIAAILAVCVSNIVYRKNYLNKSKE